MHHLSVFANRTVRTLIPALPFGSGSDPEDDPAEPARFTREAPRDDLP
jgi:hypothetical protein